MTDNITPNQDTAPAQDPAKGAVVLEVRDLSVDFGVDKKWVPAAIGLNYEVRAGEVLAIVGESGSGKSASSMALLGLLPSNSRVSGSVRLSGKELLGANAANIREVRGKDVAVIFQEPMTALNPVYTVGAQIVETVRLHNEVSPEQAKERALRMLELVELPDPEKAFRSYPHQLSGGQRQRAMIAQSLSCDPKLLIADEPTTALDVTVQAEILDLMRNLRNKLDSAIVLITHDMGVVADLADRIAVMRQGLIVETGTAEQVFRNPGMSTPRRCWRPCRTSAKEVRSRAKGWMSPLRWLLRPMPNWNRWTTPNCSGANARTPRPLLLQPPNGPGASLSLN